MTKRLGFLSGITLALALAAPVAAGQPANHACFGETVRVAAHAGADFGAFVAGVARENVGVGQAVQDIQAGLVPDEAFPNACND
jgi:hypothetical protein